jgi:hypothetical protein
MTKEKNLRPASEAGNRNTLVRRVDDDGNEEGPYMAVESSMVEGVDWRTGKLNITHVNAQTIDTSGDDPTLTGKSVKLDPDEIVSVIGKFDVDH